MRRLFFIAAIISAFTISAMAQVTMYQAPRQHGLLANYSAGVHTNWRDLRLGQSISVAPGYLARACNDFPNNQQALCITYPEGSYDLRQLNKKVVHLTVQLPQDGLTGKTAARLYTNQDQTGASLALSATAQLILINSFVGGLSMVDGQQAPAWSRTASSIQIREGFRAIITVGNSPTQIYSTREPNTITLRAGRHNFSNKFDGNISSIKIERDEMPGVMNPNVIRQPVVNRW